MTEVDHAAAAARALVDAAAREQRTALAVIARLHARRRGGHVEGGAQPRELSAPAGVGQETEVADAAEAGGQHVQQEAADELAGIERHRLALVPAAVILPAEADATVLACEQTAVGDGDPMRVAPEVVENPLWPAERSLGVDDPWEAAQRLDLRAERRGIAQPGEIAAKRQVAGLEGRRKTIEEQAAVEMREDADGQEEAGTAAGDEAPVRAQAASRHDAVDVRVMRERLPPRVQDGDHPGLGAQMLRIGAGGADGLGRSLEQDVVDHGRTPPMVGRPPGRAPADASAACPSRTWMMRMSTPLSR